MFHSKGWKCWAIVVCFTAGCVSSTVKWYKPGATATSFAQDKEDCENIMLGAGDRGGVPKQVYTFEGCMERKGWQPIPASSQ